MKIFSITFFVAVIVVSGAMQQQGQKSSTVSRVGVYKGTGTASFYSVAPIQNIDAHSSEIKSMLNTGTNEIVFDVPMRSFQFKNGKMQTDFNEDYLESDKYPNATFEGKITDPVDLTKNGEYTATVDGKLTIHGIAKPVKQTGTINVTDGKVTLKSTFNIEKIVRLDANKIGGNKPLVFDINSIFKDSNALQFHYFKTINLTQ
jgi:hypothetical protein